MSVNKEKVRKLVAFFDDLIARLRQTDMEIGIGDRRIAEDLGTVHLVAIIKPIKTASGVMGNYEITRKPIRGTSEMAELFNFTVVPGFTGYGTDIGTPDLHREFEAWIGKTIERRIAEKARRHFSELVEVPETAKEPSQIPDPVATAEAIKLSLNRFMQEWHESASLREEFCAEFSEAKKARKRAEATEAECKARAGKILDKF